MAVAFGTSLTLIFPFIHTNPTKHRPGIPRPIRKMLIWPSTNEFERIYMNYPTSDSKMPIIISNFLPNLSLRGGSKIQPIQIPAK